MSHSSKIQKKKTSTRDSYTIDEIKRFSTQIAEAVREQLRDSVICNIIPDSNGIAQEVVFSYQAETSDFHIFLSDPTGLVNQCFESPICRGTFKSEYFRAASDANDPEVSLMKEAEISSDTPVHIYHAKNLEDLRQGVNSMLDHRFQIEFDKGPTGHYIN